MESAKIQNTDEHYVLCENNNRPYSLVFAENGNEIKNGNCAISVKNRREVELLLLSLGEEVNVVMDKQARMSHPDVWDWLHGRTHAEIFTDLKWSYREEKEVLDIIDKIPMPEIFINKYVTEPEELNSKRIDQQFVHKVHQENVLISKPYRYGNMYYFEGFKASSEIHIDHDSDHLEGIIIFEAARQAGIASAHLEGMPFDGTIVILEAVTRYSKFVDYHEPYLIRTIPACKPKSGRGFCVYNIVQSGKSCASGCFTVFVYNSRKIYDKFRNSKLIDKISEDKLSVGQYSFN